MNRYRVKTEDGELRLYYPTLEDAQADYPDAEITLCEDLSHIKYIEQMFNAVDKVCGMTERKGSLVYLLRFKTSAGDCYVTLHKDTNDGVWYDLCEYQLHKIDASVVPIFKAISTPKEFCLKFLSPKTEYIVLCMGNKLSKPKELKGIKNFASVSFIPNRCTCQLFLDDSDLYIKHPDYFSPTYCRPEDYGTPLSYRAKKYGISVPKNKFIYDDNWGAIVLRREAWIKISNFCFLICHLDNVQVSTAVWSLLCRYHSWPETERNTDWSLFLEAVADTTRQHLLERSIKK